MFNNTTVALFSKGYPHYVVSDVLLYVVSSAVLLINAGIVLLFLVQRWRRPSKTQLSPAGILVINLLISDALVGAMGIFITATFTPSGFTSWPYGCVNRITPRFFFRMGSHMALINVALDRYIAIMHTLHYRDWVTMERCLTLIGIGWIVPVVGIAYAYLANNWRPGLVFCYEIRSFTFFLTYIRLPCHIAALLCVVLIQCRIFFHLRNHEKNKQSPQYLRQYSRKSAQVLLWVTTTYVVCWLPFDIMLLLLLFLHRPYFKIILDGVVLLAYSSYLVNTFIFSYKTENIRKPVSELWHDVCKAARADKKDTSPGDGNQEKKGGVKRLSSMYSSSSILTASSAVSQNENPVDVTLHI